MAHDEVLAARIRDLLAAEEVTERRMFGGLAFLLDGHLAVAVSGRGGIMVRVDPDRTEHLLATTGAEPMIMRDRQVRGWVRVPDTHLRTNRQLTTWVTRGLARARTTD